MPEAGCVCCSFTPSAAKALASAGGLLKKPRWDGLGACGAECFRCPVFKASNQGGPGLKKREAKRLSILYGREVLPEDVSCAGCKAPDSLLFHGCQDCPARACAGEKGLTRCLECGEYVCAKIDPAAKA